MSNYYETQLNLALEAQGFKAAEPEKTRAIKRGAAALRGALNSVIRRKTEEAAGVRLFNKFANAHGKGGVPGEQRPAFFIAMTNKEQAKSLVQRFERQADSLSQNAQMLSRLLEQDDDAIVTEVLQAMRAEDLTPEERKSIFYDLQVALKN